MVEILRKLTAFLNSPIPDFHTNGLFKTLSQFILIFAVFYFAVFDYQTSSERIVRGIIEFFLVAFSLVIAFAVFRLITICLEKWLRIRFSPTYAYNLLFFLAIYSLGMGIVYLLKQSLWDFEKAWFWNYYWRHLPYAFLMFVVFLYRAHKNSVITQLVDKLNAKLKNRRVLADSETSDSRQSRKEVPIRILADGIPHHVLPSTISHVSVNGHYLDLFYQDNNDITQVCFRKPLTEFLSELPTGKFLRTHRSHFVNPMFITRLKKYNRRYSVSLSQDRYIIPISRTHLPHILSFLEHKFTDRK